GLKWQRPCHTLPRYRCSLPGLAGFTLPRRQSHNLWHATGLENSRQRLLTPQRPARQRPKSTARGRAFSALRVYPLAQMSPLSEVSLVVRRELRKNFRSAKGIVLCILTLLGALGLTLLFAWLAKKKREMLGTEAGSDEAFQMFVHKAAQGTYGNDVA